MAKSRYFKVPVHDGEEFECMWPFIIIDVGPDGAIEDAYETALGMPLGLGDATDDGEYDMPPICEITDPLSEPWPVFTQAYLAREDEELKARLAKPPLRRIDVIMQGYKKALEKAADE